VSVDEGALGMDLTPIPIDSIADAALTAKSATERAPHCDACDEPIEGEAGGHGLFLWSRGEEMRVEEPPLCVQCATAITATALSGWSVEEEEG
jgi:hypothetical protein